MLRPRFTIFSLISPVLCCSQVTVPTYCRTVTYVYAYFPAYFYFLKCIKNFANCFSLCYNGVMQRWSSWLMASASKAEEPQGSGGSNPSRCVFSRKYYISFLLFIRKKSFRQNNRKAPLLKTNHYVSLSWSNTNITLLRIFHILITSQA